MFLSFMEHRYNSTYSVLKLFILMKLVFLANSVIECKSNTLAFLLQLSFLRIFFSNSIFEKLYANFLISELWS
jgi:hypothetical protein